MVRLISEDGNQVGIVAVQKALSLAQSKDLDLVEIAPDADPPVCRIMDYGKYKYKLEIMEKEKRKKQSHIVIKEIKLRPKIDTNDLNTKIKHIERFLKNGNKVKVTVMFKGREIVHKEIGDNLIDKILKSLEGKYVVDQRPKMEGHNMVMVLGSL